MKTTPKTVLFAFIFTILASPLWAQGTYTAASCNYTDVNAVINGPTHQAKNGDVIQIPPGSCTWTSGLTIPSNVGISIIGNGTPNSTPATTGASASCINTAITLSGVTLFKMTPSYGNSISRISCMKLVAGSGIAFSVLGTCTSSGCPNLRVDNITFSGWAGHANAGISYGISAVGNMFGTLDHNTINGSAGNYLQLVEFSHANYLGVGSYGDNAWAQPESYGSANFLFIENNTFNTAGCCENEGTAGSLANQGGGRVVVRFNQFNNMDNLNFSIGWHGTESSGRPRSTRAFEYYGNTWTCATGQGCGDVVSSRGGTGLVWGNTVNHSGSSLNNFYTMQTYRAFSSINWGGACDGSSVYDANDGTTYFTGTIASVAGQVVTISSSPGWSTSQWSPVGAPYSMHDVTKSTGGEITGNGPNTLTVNSGSGGPGTWTPSAGDSIQILRARACIDQAGGRGAGILYDATDPATPASSSAESASAGYVWSNTINGGAPVFAYVGSSTLRVIRNRDFYNENLNQAAQSSSTTPFDGTSTIGMGHGTLGDRPTTCTTGAGYWATDQGNWNGSGNMFGQGELFVCTAPNTWAVYYTPYSYPHPLTTQESGTAPPFPPTSLVTTIL